jgi:flagellar hook assembly protein FlgD
MPAQHDVNIGIYDLNGRHLWARRVNASETEMGENFITWDLKNEVGVEAANGVYIFEIQADGRFIHKKIAVVK